MRITKEFLICEIESLESELQKAVHFQIQAQATINAYKMLIQRLDTTDPQLEEEGSKDAS